MHDIEGVCSYVISSILYVIHFKCFSLETLNNYIQYFNYGSLKIQNKPHLITINILKMKKKLKMSANEMLCFSRHLGIIISDLLPENSEIWQLY